MPEPEDVITIWEEGWWCPDIWAKKQLTFWHLSCSSAFKTLTRLIFVPVDVRIRTRDDQILRVSLPIIQCHEQRNSQFPVFVDDKASDFFIIWTPELHFEAKLKPDSVWCILDAAQIRCRCRICLDAKDESNKNEKKTTQHSLWRTEP